MHPSNSIMYDGSVRVHHLLIDWIDLWFLDELSLADVGLVAHGAPQAQTNRLRSVTSLDYVHVRRLLFPITLMSVSRSVVLHLLVPLEAELPVHLIIYLVSLI